MEHAKMTIKIWSKLQHGTNAAWSACVMKGNPYFKFVLSMNSGMRWSALQSSGQRFCTESMLLETHAIWSFQKQFLILGIRDALKCNRKASGQLKVYDWTYYMSLKQWLKSYNIFKVTSILCPKVALQLRWITDTDSVPLNPL